MTTSEADRCVEEVPVIIKAVVMKAWGHRHAYKLEPGSLAAAVVRV
jgi:hypothetical protein